MVSQDGYRGVCSKTRLRVRLLPGNSNPMNSALFRDEHHVTMGNAVELAVLRLISVEVSMVSCDTSDRILTSYATLLTLHHLPIGYPTHVYFAADCQTLTSPQESRKLHRIVRRSMAR